MYKLLILALLPLLCFGKPIKLCSHESEGDVDGVEDAIQAEEEGFLDVGQFVTKRPTTTTRRTTTTTTTTTTTKPPTTTKKTTTSTCRPRKPTTTLKPRKKIAGPKCMVGAKLSYYKKQFDTYRRFHSKFAALIAEYKTETAANQVEYKKRVAKACEDAKLNRQEKAEIADVFEEPDDLFDAKQQQPPKKQNNGKKVQKNKKINKGQNKKQQKPAAKTSTKPTKTTTQRRVPVNRKPSNNQSSKKNKRMKKKVIYVTAEEDDTGEILITGSAGSKIGTAVNA